MYKRETGLREERKIGQYRGGLQNIGPRSLVLVAKTNFITEVKTLPPSSFLSVP